MSSQAAARLPEAVARSFLGCNESLSSEAAEPARAGWRAVSLARWECRMWNLMRFITVPGGRPCRRKRCKAGSTSVAPPTALGVADGNYPSKGGDLVRARADAIVWLDFPRSAVMRHLVVRTSRRLLLRQQLWNGNRESLRNVLARDPERSILRWAWTRHEAQRAAYAAQVDDRWIRLTSRAEVRRFLAASSAPNLVRGRYTAHGPSDPRDRGTPRDPPTPSHRGTGQR